MNRKKLILTIVLSAAFGSMLTVLFAGGLLRMTGIYGDDVLRLFGVMKFIQARYVSAPDTTALIDGAINGMVASLGDPHSVYMPPDMFKELRQHTEGAFGGIGVTMGFKDRTVKIISVLEGTPGEAAGLRAGDEILTVDGTPTSEMQSEEVALRIRGEAGTNVVLRILRDGTEQEYTITRAVIQVPSVRGVITSCVAVAEQVVPEGPIVSVINRDGDEEVYKSHLTARKYPIAVLIDENSASASEILAGALQDTGAAEIIGTTSYGKGSVQAVLPLFHEDGLKLTIAKYVTPNGRSIDGTGITPDIIVNRSPKDVTDAQFEAAKQWLLEHPTL